MSKSSLVSGPGRRGGAASSGTQVDATAGARRINGFAA
jgi:hypothetical protein